MNTTWNLKPLASGDKDSTFKEKRKVIEKEIMAFVNKWKNRKDYLENPGVLKDALDEYEKLLRFHGSGGDEEFYFWLRTSQDQVSPELKASWNGIQDFARRLGNELNFFTLNIAKIPLDKQKAILAYKPLEIYRHTLERAFASAKHNLSESEERIMSLKSAPSHEKWVDLVEMLISKEEREIINDKGKKEIKNFSEIMSLVADRNKKTRDSAANAVNDIIARWQDIAEAEINSILLNKKVDDELRKFERPDSERHLSDDVDSSVVDALIESVKDNFSISRELYELKAKLMGVKKLEYHERSVPYGNVEKKYSYEEAYAMVKEILSTLDASFVRHFERFDKEGLIDVYPKKGKSGGAFCVHWMISQPTYILLNYTNQLRDVTTLAHEFGHALNNELMKERCNALTFGTPLATAEVASNFIESFVFDKLLKEANEEDRLALLINSLSDEVSSIQRQVACYRFEKDLHEAFRKEGYLSKERIGEIFQKNMSEYMGDFVEQSPGSQNWWIYWSHIRNFFYVYSYASGLLIAKAMQRSVIKDKKFVGKVKEFLSSGYSASPKDIFMRMDIDITKKEFWNQGLEQMRSKLKEAESLAKKLKKIKS